MNLSRKTLLLLMCVTLLSFGAAITEQQIITIPAFKALEARADRKDVERVLTGFDALRNTLHVMTYDYALWDQTFQYFEQHQNPESSDEYIDSNYVIDTFLGSAIDLVAFADTDGHIFWHKLANLEEERFYPTQHYDPSELAVQLPDVKQAYPGAPVSRSGIVATRLGPMIFSAYSVHNSNGSGVSPGSLLMGRLINADTIREVQQLVKVPFNARVISADKQHDLPDGPLSAQQRNADNQFHWYLQDINDQPIMKLSLDVGDSAVDHYELNNPAVIAFILTTFSWLVVVGYLNWSVVRPMLKIKTHLKQIRLTGNYYPRLGSHRDDEIGDLSDECDALIDQIEKQNRILAKQAAELRKLSLEDGLTGLSNRRHFDQLLEDYWSIHQREQQPLSLIMFDIDYFKRFNDNYGHQAGDRALEQVGMATTNMLVRKADKAARYGGEEFVLLLPDTDPLGVVEVAKHLQQAITELAIPHRYSSVADTLTISIGCTTLTPDSKTSAADLVQQADRALYRAKSLGRNQITIFDPETD